MFTERNIKKAFQTICELYDEEDCWMLDDDYFAAEGISNRCIVRALKERMEDAFEYKVLSDAGTHLDYRGKCLFDQRAVHILTHENHSVADYHYGMEYDVELWFLEDTRFVIVYCFRTIIEKYGGLSALTEYRVVEKEIESSDDLFFSIEELLEELDCICSLAESYQR